MSTALLPSSIAELDGREALDHVLDQLVGELLLVAPVAVAEDALEGVGVDPLDLLHGVFEGRTNVLRGGADVVSVTAVGVWGGCSSVKSFGVNCVALSLNGLAHPAGICVTSSSQRPRREPWSKSDSLQRSRLL